jgi:diguanylate cyclase (GGDEF)-like protein
MLDSPTPQFLLASPEPRLLAAMEPVLRTLGARVQVVLSAEAALAAMTAAEPPSLALLDLNLHGMDLTTKMDQLLTAVRAAVSGKRLAIVLIAGAVTPEWSRRLDEGVIQDMVLRNEESSYWQLRLEQVLRSQGLACELDALRESAVQNAQLDRLTGVFNRETLLSMLFCETDRAQRMRSSLSLVLFDIDDFGHWNSRLGAEACDELLRQVAGRTSRLLRSYDLLGRAGKDEFLLGLPGCDAAFAASLTQRLCRTVFCEPFRVAGESIRLSACFGIAVSLGRSPLVVLREAEEALLCAKGTGPESIQCFAGAQSDSPATFFSPTSGEDQFTC